MFAELVHSPVDYEGEGEIIQGDVLGILAHDEFQEVEQRIIRVIALTPAEHLAKVADDLLDVFTLNFTER